MAKKSNKQIAHELYLAGLSMKDIASILELTPTTISRYAKDSRWKEQRTEREITEMSIYDTTLELLHYQLSVLKTKKDAWLTGTDDPKPLIDKGEIDALTKLYSTIKKDLTNWEHYIKVMREFVIYAQEHDQDLAKRILNLQDDFIQLKRKQFGI